VAEGVPTIDVSSLVDLPSIDSITADLEVVAKIRDACSTWGFFQITGHRVDEDLVSRFYNAQKQFFALPEADKELVRRRADNSKGWYNNELTKQKVDWKEGFDLGAQDGTLDKTGLDGYNVWPAKPEQFESTMREYFARMEALSRYILAAMTVGLGEGPAALIREFDSAHSSYLRLNYYPVCPDPSKHWSISEHSDAGALTILTQGPNFDVRSLQVYQPADKRWYDVEPIPGSFTINTGDVMQVWSNDRYKAPLHRVKAQLSKERYV
jgi:isopenicillin N synthase-like dioxygenase